MPILTSWNLQLNEWIAHSFVSFEFLSENDISESALHAARSASRAAAPIYDLRGHLRPSFHLLPTTMRFQPVVAARTLTFSRLIWIWNMKYHNISMLRCATPSIYYIVVLLKRLPVIKLIINYDKYVEILIKKKRLILFLFVLYFYFDSNTLYAPFKWLLVIDFFAMRERSAPLNR